MKDLREIIKAYDAALHAGKKSALAAVVHLNGSSYRRPGARMMVTDDGELTGAISGGCLEGDALRKAMMVLSQQQSRLVTYDTSDEDDATIGLQLGCAGIIEVLFEPIDPNNHNNPIQLLRKAMALRQKSVLVTLFSLEDKRNEQPGTCLLMEENGNISGTIPYPELYDTIMEDVHQTMQQQTSSFKNYAAKNISVTCFIEFLKPSISLVVVGAGNDAIPMMQIADTIGWEVRVVDGRSTHAKPQRFVSACQVLVSKPEKVLEQIPIDDQTVFVMMTHNYNYDLAMLRALLLRKVTYIGMLGPKKKLDRMLGELRDDGIELTKKQLNTIYGPVGLEIGAETAEEIALSIIAEIKAVCSGKTGGSLRNKEDVIHSRKDTLIEKKIALSRMHYTVEHCAIVVLAAGISSRLGSPKHLLAYQGKSLLQHAVQIALQTTMRPVFVVVGANSKAVRKQIEEMEVEVVDNKEWQEGMASSLRCGLGAVQKMNGDLDGIIFMVCDQPYISTSLLNDLINKQRETGQPIVTCNYGEAIGPPALFHKTFFPELLKLKGDAGARKIIQQNNDKIAIVLFPKGSIDIDTRNDYEELVQKK